jgi:hypothetical protein
MVWRRRLGRVIRRAARPEAGKAKHPRPEMGKGLKQEL